MAATQSGPQMATGAAALLQAPSAKTMLSEAIAFFMNGPPQGQELAIYIHDSLTGRTIFHCEKPSHQEH
jgi:hypothetical protein